MKVTIVTATYNSAATVRDTLESVKNQSYGNIEHLIIDGLSKDNTLDIIKEYKDHIAHQISEKDNGIYDAMNKGVSLATGDIIGILNSDDFYAHPDVVKNVVEAFQQNNVDTVYGDLKFVDPIDTKKIVRSWRAGAFKRDKFLYGWMPPHPSFFVKSDLYNKYGTFDTSFTSSADYELMLRFLYRHQVSTHYLPEVLVLMRTGGLSNYSLKNRLVANKEDKNAWKKNNFTPRFYTTLLKPLRKINQYFKT